MNDPTLICMALLYLIIDLISYLIESIFIYYLIFSEWLYKQSFQQIKPDFHLFFRPKKYYFDTWLNKLQIFQFEKITQFQNTKFLVTFKPFSVISSKMRLIRNFFVILTHDSINCKSFNSKKITQFQNTKCLVPFKLFSVISSKIR